MIEPKDRLRPDGGAYAVDASRGPDDGDTCAFESRRPLSWKLNFLSLDSGISTSGESVIIPTHSFVLPLQTLGVEKIG